MKHLLLIFIFIGISVQAVEYKPNIGIKGIIPVDLGMTSTAKCAGCKGDLTYKWGGGLVLNNDFKLTEFFTISLTVIYQYGAVHLIKSHQEDPENNSEWIEDYNYDYMYHLAKISPNIKFFFSENIYSKLGIVYDYYFNLPKELKVNRFNLSLELGFGYFFRENQGFEFSLEAIKDFDISVKSRAYLNLGLSFLYLF